MEITGIASCKAVVEDIGLSLAEPAKGSADLDLRLEPAVHCSAVIDGHSSR